MTSQREGAPIHLIDFVGADGEGLVTMALVLQVGCTLPDLVVAYCLEVDHDLLGMLVDHQNLVET